MFDPNHPQLGEYLEPFTLGQPLHGGGIGRVISSNHADFQEGHVVCLPFLGYEWKRYIAVDAAGGDGASSFPTIDISAMPLPALALGAAGMPGLTAYFCLFRQGAPQVGETVVVSGAAGACGTLAGQFAKMAVSGDDGDGDGRVVGLCGSDEKCAHLIESCGYDVAINYKTHHSHFKNSADVVGCMTDATKVTAAVKSNATLLEALQSACPNGVDVYYDNTGGSTSENVLSLTNCGARVPICGQISEYEKDVPYMTLVSADGIPPGLRKDLGTSIRAVHRQYNSKIVK
jgi:NADPH-dependent curcumin reductase CurA